MAAIIFTILIGFLVFVAFSSFLYCFGLLIIRVNKIEYADNPRDIMLVGLTYTVLIFLACAGAYILGRIAESIF